MAGLRANAKRFDPYRNFKFRVTLQGRPVAGVKKLVYSASWDDLVLPRAAMARLRSIAARVPKRAVVHEPWTIASGRPRRRGIRALFHGPAGSGRTLAAIVLATELDRDLFFVDLDRVVGTYVGETEKNLRRVFEAAEGRGAVLFFDEADALFRRRGDVKDSHDRYANLRIRSLRRHVEAHPGLSLFATDLPHRIGSAMRLGVDSVVRFRLPGPGGAGRSVARDPR